MSRRDLAIVIASFNQRELLENCLGSISAHCHGAVETCVVDNASSDGGPETLQRQFPQVQFICNTTNRGFAAATNQGVRATSAPYILLLNSDTEVSATGLDELVEFAKSNCGVGVVGPQLVNSDGSLQPNGHRVPGVVRTLAGELGLDRLLGKRRFTQRRRDYSKTAVVDEVSGACLLTTRAVMNSVGELDEEFFFGYEDIDYCNRVRDGGWQVVYYPKVRVVHHWGASSNPTDPGFAAECLRSRHHYYYKRFGRAFSAGARAIALFKSTAALVALGFLGARGAERRRIYRALARASVRRGSLR